VGEKIREDIPFKVAAGGKIRWQLHDCDRSLLDAPVLDRKLDIREWPASARMMGLAKKLGKSAFQMVAEIM